MIRWRRPGLFGSGDKAFLVFAAGIGLHLGKRSVNFLALRMFACYSRTLR